MGWDGLVTHPFWQGGLQHLTKDLETSSDLRQSVQQSIANFSSSVAASQSEMLKANSVLGQIHAVDIDTHRTDQVDGAERPGKALLHLLCSEINLLAPNACSSLADTANTLRPLTAPGSGDPKVSFTLR